MQLIPLLVFLLLSGCSQAQERTVEIDSQTLNDIAPYLASHPLPAGYVFAVQNENSPRTTDTSLPAGRNNPPAGRLVRRTIDWHTTGGEAPGAAAGNTAPDGASVRTARTVFAPAVTLWDARENVSFADVSGGNVEVKPIEAIFPPERALPVDGRYPDDPSYPLIAAEWVSCSTDDGELAGWFSGLAASRSFQNGERRTYPVSWIGGAGDLMVGRGVEDVLIWGKNGSERIFGDVLPELRAADILIGNLEGAVTRRGEPAEKSYTFRFRPGVLPVLRAAGFDYLSITNNHSFDFGLTGFTDTLSALAASGIGTSGAGTTPSAAETPWKADTDGTAVTVLSLGAYPVERTGFDGRRTAAVSQEKPGILWADERTFAAVRAAAGDDTFDIVVVHGGNEWWNTPSPSQRQLYRKLIDEGADLVLGSHPHVLQGIEAYRGKAIMYSLGNFIFPGMQETEYGEDSLLLIVGVYKGAARYFRYIPVKLNGAVVSQDRSGRILSRFLALTRAENESGSE